MLASTRATHDERPIGEKARATDTSGVKPGDAYSAWAAQRVGIIEPLDVAPPIEALGAD